MNIARFLSAACMKMMHLPCRDAGRQASFSHLASQLCCGLRDALRAVYSQLRMDISAHLLSFFKELQRETGEEGDHREGGKRGEIIPFSAGEQGAAACIRSSRHSNVTG